MTGSAGGAQGLAQRGDRLVDRPFGGVRRAQGVEHHNAVDDALTGRTSVSPHPVRVMAADL
jgi:hypothetical protein